MFSLSNKINQVKQKLPLHPNPTRQKQEGLFDSSHSDLMLYKGETNQANCSQGDEKFWLLNIFWIES